MLFTAGIKANFDCDKVSGTGHTAADNQGAFQGTASFKINGATVNAAITTVLLGPPRVTEDGTLHATTSHTFVFEDGTFTTLDSAV